MQEIEPIAKPGTHDLFLKFLRKHSTDNKKKVLDLGAGHGAFSKKLFNLGYNVYACDLFPEIFKFNKVECLKVDLTKEFPYKVNTFDIVVAIEVSEHITNHEVVFSEISRILKKGGHFLLSTPNILSLKSRIRFLFKGFFFSFNPLDPENNSGLQHVASLTIDQYNYIALRNGFEIAMYDIDKTQKSSMWLLGLLLPFLNKSSIHNKYKILLGRKIFMNFRKS